MKQYEDSLNEVVERVRLVNKFGNGSIELSDWQRLEAWHQSLMRKVYRQATRDLVGVMDRVLLFIEYVNEQPSSLETWKIINLWRLAFPYVETYFNLKKLGIGSTNEEKGHVTVMEMVYDPLNLQYSELLSIMYRYKPNTIYDWIAGFVNLRKEKGGHYGRRAQSNFTKRVVRWELAELNRQVLEGNKHVFSS